MADGEVAVATFGSELEASMMAELLRKEGILSVLVPLGPGVGGLGATAFRPFELRVRAADAAHAKRLLEAYGSR